MNQAPFYQIDAFTEVPFKGNPAAVCLMPCNLKDDLYQSIAKEMNLSARASALLNCTFFHYKSSQDILKM